MNTNEYLTSLPVWDGVPRLASPIESNEADAGLLHRSTVSAQSNLPHSPPELLSVWTGEIEELQAISAALLETRKP